MPKVQGVGQTTLTDMNDVLASATAPLNPQDGALWWNTNDSKLYVYQGGKWIFAGDGLVIGGRNIFRNSSFITLTGWTGYQSVNAGDFQGYNSLTLTRTNWVTGNSRWQINYNITTLPLIKSGSQYTLSCWVYVDSSIPLVGGNSNSLSVRFYKDSDGSMYDNLVIDLSTLQKDTWVRVTATASISVDIKPNANFLVSISQNGKVKISKPQLEIGGIATDWEKAPEDIDDSITNIQNTLGNMANDGLLDLSERKIIKSSLAEIYGYTPPDRYFRNDFFNKVSGSTTVNPNIMKVGWGASILTPSGFTTEPAQTNYDQIKMLDGTLYGNSTATNTQISQTLFSFNVVSIFEKKFGTIPASDKIQWLKSNITTITFNWYGYGSSPTGSKAYLKRWDATASSWIDVTNHTNGTVTKLSSFPPATVSIQNDGMLHMMVCADASNGTTSSAIYTDFAEIEFIFTTLPNVATLDASLKGEFYNVRKSALNAGVSSSDSKYTALATAYTSLETYLESLTPTYAWDTSDKDASLNITVEKGTFRQKWLDYYTAVKDLATATADQLKKNVDNLNINTTNWGSNGNFAQTDLTKALWSGSYVGQTSEVIDISSDTPPFHYAYHVNNTTNANGGIFTPVLWSGVTAQAMVDMEITISFWLKYQNIVQGVNSWQQGRFGELIIEGETSTATKVYRYPRLNASNNTSTESIYVSGTNMVWTKYSVTHKLSLPATAVKLTKISFKHGLEGCTGEFWTTGIQIQFGNRATDWTPSHLDLEDRISKAEFKVRDDQILLSVMQSDTINAQILQDYTFENGVQYWKQDHALTTAPTNTTVISGQSVKGANVVQITGEKWMFYGKRMPIQTDHIYKVTFRVRQMTNPTTAGKAKVYAGVGAYNSSKGVLTASKFGSHRYCAVVTKDIAVADGWQEFSGIITGEGDEGYGQFITGTRYAVPMFIVNYQGGDGVVQVDYCSLEDVTATQNLATQINGLSQKFTPDGIFTEISRSVTYKNYTDSVVTDQKLSDKGYATTGDVKTAVDNIDVEGGASKAIDDMISNKDSTLTKTFATKYELAQTSDSFTTKFSSTGGMNIVRNSIGFSPLGTDINNPDRNFVPYGTTSRILRVSNDGTLTALGFGSAFQFNSGTSTQYTYIDQKVPVIIGKPYTLSWSAMKTNASPSTDNNGALYIQILEETTVGVWNVMKEYKYNSETIVDTFTTAQLDSAYYPSKANVIIRVRAEGLCNALVTGIMFSIGDIALQWSLATGESYNTNVRLDINGVRVSQYKDTGAGKVEVGYTQISPDEFAGFYDTDGDGVFEKVFYLNGDETVTKKIKALNEFTMGSLKIVRVPVDGGTSTYTGWAIVPVS